MSKHTPGPWIHEYGNDTGPNDDYFVEFYEVIAAEKVIGRFDSEEDARLASAAPYLLEALEYMLNCQYDFDPRRQADCDMCSKARAAIAKARGEA